MLALLYALICGITLAALVHAMHVAVVCVPRADAQRESMSGHATSYRGANERGTTSDFPGTTLYFDTLSDRVWSFTVSTLAGPYLLMDIATTLFRERQINFATCLFAFALSALWALTSGIVTLELAARALW